MVSSVLGARNGFINQKLNQNPRHKLSAMVLDPLFVSKKILLRQNPVRNQIPLFPPSQ